MPATITMKTSIQRIFPLAVAGLVAGLLAADATWATVLSQDTTGITHGGGGEAGFTDQIEFSTSEGPAGAAAASLTIRLDAPAGQVFEFDGAAYPDGVFNFHFESAVFGDLTGVTATDPVFSLLDPTGSLALSLVNHSADNISDAQLKFITDYTISGTGTFSGFQQQSTLSGASGQTITWIGGFSDISWQSGSDEGPVVALVPEPIPLLPVAAVLVGSLVTGRLRSRGGSRSGR